MYAPHIIVVHVAFTVNVVGVNKPSAVMKFRYPEDITTSVTPTQIVTLDQSFVSVPKTTSPLYCTHAAKVRLARQFETSNSHNLFTTPAVIIPSHILHRRTHWQSFRLIVPLVEYTHTNVLPCQSTEGNTFKGHHILFVLRMANASTHIFTSNSILSTSICIFTSGALTAPDIVPNQNILYFTQVIDS